MFVYFGAHRQILLLFKFKEVSDFV